MSAANPGVHEPRCWIVVASRDHVETGVAGGFMQACHGKRRPMRRVRPGDGVLFYSPRTAFRGGALCQAFTALGRVVGEEAWQAEMGAGFRPWRRRVEFADARPVAIRPLLDELSFTKGRKNWGMKFRYGSFEIPAADFRRIEDRML